MDARYTCRKSPLLDECQGAPEIFEHVIPRLYSFMQPVVNVFHGKAAAQHAKISVCGLLSDVQHQNIASMQGHLVFGGGIDRQLQQSDKAF
jgi:hypothetical protein